jgi:hypothetical protein
MTECSHPVVWDEDGGDEYSPKPVDPFIVWDESGGEE